jgi:uncharacterized lipoprotein YmbA
MRRATLIPLILAALAALATAACIGGRASPGTQHHVLSPVIETPPAATANAETLRVVGVGPVSLPAYLDRPQMVMRPTPDRIEISEFDQWGEPLRDGVTRVVAVNLARLLPESLVVTFPWRSTEKIRYQVILEVVQMDGPAGGNVALDARWRVLDRSGSEVAARVSRLSEPAGTGTTAAAMSRALGVLSHDIARELKATEKGLR